MQHIQMNLSEKKFFFSELFDAFFKFTLNFQHFQKDDPHNLCISQITDPERRV